MIASGQLRPAVTADHAVSKADHHREGVAPATRGLDRRREGRGDADEAERDERKHHPDAGLDAKERREREQSRGCQEWRIPERRPGKHDGGDESNEQRAAEFDQQDDWKVEPDGARVDLAEQIRVVAADVVLDLLNEAFAGVAEDR